MHIRKRCYSKTKIINLQVLHDIKFEEKIKGKK